jgi:uncharacterized protein YfiM (DUF2279 family)
MKSCSILILLHLSVFNPCFSQDSTSSKRLKPLLISSALLYTGTMAALSQTWYQEHDRTSFHFFNDNAEWKQMDKAGHFYTGYHLSAISYKGLRWSGMTEPKAAILGATAGLIMLLPVEWLDGYSKKYGASTGDIVADVAGSAFFLSQQRLWKESRIIPKFSFHRTSYASHRPEALGKGLSEEWLKDYNGQTYWLSFDTDKFIPTKNKWLSFVNMAVGYGAHGMVYARDEQNSMAGFSNYRQYYLALDPDLSAIRTRNKVLKTLIYIINAIHLPAPAIAYGQNDWKFYLFYF